MIIREAIFARGVVGPKNLMEDDLPHVAFIGRSNVGKSSVINSLVNNKKLARSSSTAGRTQEINFFLINRAFYFVDLPGFGYARGSHEKRNDILQLIYWYLFESEINQYKIVMILDARIGMTENDVEVYNDLIEHNKDVVLVLNKIDKLNQSEKQASLKKLKQIIGENKFLQYSAEKKTGVQELLDLICPIS